MAILTGVVLDAGPLIAAQRDERRFWAWWRWLTSLRVVATVPAPVIAQTWRGAGTARLGQVLGACQIVPMDGESARRTGELCAAAGTSDVVDALVVHIAATRGYDVLTGDPRDLRALAAHAPGVGRVLTLDDMGR